LVERDYLRLKSGRVKLIFMGTRNGGEIGKWITGIKAKKEKGDTWTFPQPREKNEKKKAANLPGAGNGNPLGKDIKIGKRRLKGKEVGRAVTGLGLAQERFRGEWEDF